MATNPLEASIQALVDVLRSLPGGIRTALRGRGAPPPGGVGGNQAATATGFGQGTVAIGAGILGQIFPPMRRLTHEFGALADAMRILRESSVQGRTLAGVTGQQPLNQAQRQALIDVARSPLLSPQERQRVGESIQHMNQTDRIAAVATRDFQVAQRQAADTVSRVRQQVVRGNRQRDTTIGRIRQGVVKQRQRRDTSLGRLHQANRREQRSGARYRKAQTRFRTDLAAFQQVSAQHAANPAQFATQFITAQQTLSASQRNLDRTRSGFRSARSGARRASRRAQTEQTTYTRIRAAAAPAIRAAQGRAADIANRGKAKIKASVQRVAQRFGVAQAAGVQAATARTAAAGAGANAVSLVGGRAAAGAIGEVVQAIVELGRAALQSVNQLRVHAESVNQSNRALAGFSGNLSTAFAQLDINQIFRDMRRVRETEDSSKNLVRSIDQMRANFMQFDIAVQNLTNRVASVQGAFAGGLIKGPGKIANLFDRGAAALGIGQEDQNQGIEVLGQAAFTLLNQIASSLAGVPGIGPLLQNIANLLPDNRKDLGNDVPVAQWAAAMAHGDGNLIRQNKLIAVPVAPQMAVPPQNLFPGRPFPFGPPGAGGFGGGGPNAG